MLNVLQLIAQADATTSPESLDASTKTLEAAHVVAEPAGGLAALGLNWQAFLFQLITFVIVLVLLRQFVFKKLVKTLEDRRQTVENSITHAQETEAKLAKAEQTIAGMIADARKQADDVLAASHKEAAQMVEAAEQKAATRAELIVKDAKAQMDVEVTKAREALKAETVKLVAQATEHVLGEKLDATRDQTLITNAIKQAKDARNA